MDVDYPKKLHNKHNDLPFLTEKMKINKVEETGSKSKQQE